MFGDEGREEMWLRSHRALEALGRVLASLCTVRKLSQQLRLGVVGGFCPEYICLGGTILSPGNCGCC